MKIKRFMIWRKTAQTPAEKAECRNPHERSVRVSSAQARGKRSCFTEYQLSSNSLLHSFTILILRQIVLSDKLNKCKKRKQI